MYLYSTDTSTPDTSTKYPQHKYIIKGCGILSPAASIEILWVNYRNCMYTAQSNQVPGVLPQSVIANPRLKSLRASAATNGVSRKGSLFRCMPRKSQKKSMVV